MQIHKLKAVWEVLFSILMTDMYAMNLENAQGNQNNAQQRFVCVTDEEIFELYRSLLTLQKDIEKTLNHLKAIPTIVSRNNQQQTIDRRKTKK